jgi:hypothetical protein
MASELNHDEVIIDKQLLLDVIAELADAAHFLDHGHYTSGENARHLIQELKALLNGSES